MNDPIVYSEFLIHPLVLLSTSTKLRTEVKQTLQVIFDEVDPLPFFLLKIGKQFVVQNTISRNLIKEIIDSGPMRFTDLFQNKSVAHFNPK